MTLEEIGIAAGAVVAIAGAAGLTWKIVRSSYRSARRLGHLLDEVLGMEARGARPAVPGWAARLDEIQADVGKIKAQVFPNGGTSLRDAVDDVNVKLEDHLVEAVEARRMFADHIAGSSGVHVEVPPGSTAVVTPLGPQKLESTKQT